MVNGPILILTVPHVCVESEWSDPGCDAQSLAYARQIRKSLHRPSLMLASTTPRRICDNNRRPCRQKTRLRRRLTTLIDQLQDGLALPLVGLDLHTFHEESDFDLPPQPQYQALVLDTRRNPGTRILVNKLRQNGIRVRFVRGSTINDIQRQMQRRGIPTPLLEVRQGLEEPVIQRIAKAVNEWLDLL